MCNTYGPHTQAFRSLCHVTVATCSRDLPDWRKDDASGRFGLRSLKLISPFTDTVFLSLFGFPACCERGGHHLCASIPTCTLQTAVESKVSDDCVGHFELWQFGFKQLYYGLVFEGVSRLYVFYGSLSLTLSRIFLVERKMAANFPLYCESSPPPRLSKTLAVFLSISVTVLLYLSF